MKHLLINWMVGFILALFSHNALANIWIVNSNPGNQAKHFTTLQAANDSSLVQSGDTLYLVGSPIGYGNLTATKQLHIFGPGYFLDQNDSTQANIHMATTGKIIFQSGSGGSTITGCNVHPQATTSILDIYVNNIVIDRNRINGSHQSINIKENVNNITISRNYIIGSIMINNNVNNLIIGNNSIVAAYDYSIFSNTSVVNIILENNVIAGGTMYIYNANITNNILVHGLYFGTGNVILYNICNSTQFPSTGNNQQNVDMNTVFVGSGSVDGRLKLKSGSPAIGAGTNGTDIGMFGGDNPYVLSGIPPIPTIYKFLGSSFGSQSLPVQIKIKSRR